MMADHLLLVKPRYTVTRAMLGLEWASEPRDLDQF
jgi:hypothetical protein